MDDMSSGRVPAEPGRVDISEVWEREYWMGVFAISEEQLREAVAAVGSGTEDVKVYCEKAKQARSERS
ncbi:MAG: hypothetical protein NVSMB6_28420 [Burkholderiaceae bacterium]